MLWFPKLEVIDGEAREEGTVPACLPACLPARLPACLLACHEEEEDEGDSDHVSRNENLQPRGWNERIREPNSDGEPLSL